MQHKKYQKVTISIKYHSLISKITHSEERGATKTGTHSSYKAFMCLQCTDAYTLHQVPDSNLINQQHAYIIIIHNEV